MESAKLPNGFVLLSDAIHRLEQGMWGGLRKAKPLRAIKSKDLRGGSVRFIVRKQNSTEEPETLLVEPQGKRTGALRFGPWREEAGKLLRSAAIEGELKVYVFPANESARRKFGSEPLPLPRAVISRIIPRRQSLPGHTIRHTLKSAGNDPKILALLRDGVLLVQVKEFKAWYLADRAKCKWPSQRSTKKRREGRPSKLTASLRQAIISLMREQKTSIAELHRRLVASSRTDVPSVDTLERIVDQLYRETGDPTLHRMKRIRRKPSVKIDSSPSTCSSCQ